MRVFLLIDTKKSTNQCIAGAFTTKDLAELEAEKINMPAPAEASIIIVEVEVEEPQGETMLDMVNELGATGVKVYDAFHHFLVEKMELFPGAAGIKNVTLSDAVQLVTRRELLKARGFGPVTLEKFDAYLEGKELKLLL